MSDTVLMTIGRYLLGLYFLIPGVMKIVAWNMHIDMMTELDIPAAPALLMIATIAEIIAGLMLITGRFVRFGALGLALLIIVINVMMHGFWNMEADIKPHEMQNFIKNLGIMAGLLVLAAASPKRKLSLSGIWKADPKTDP
ncbi:MAG: DoxX family protein [Acidimicrobiales bacterium]|nr:DoxX family protein [Hyphomonadaceae bacterium]RZV40314.1 MAG: DoxX family protein [Acidimicrobiales bacterium]